MPAKVCLLPSELYLLPADRRRAGNLCFYLPRMTADIKAQLEKIDGVDVLDAAPKGAKLLFGRFYRDELELLIRTARGLRDRSKHLIAPVGDGFGIFSKPAVKGAKA